MKTKQLPEYEVNKDARTIADLVKDGEHQAAGAFFNELVTSLMLWEGLVLQDRISAILKVEYPGWRTDRGVKTHV